MAKSYKILYNFSSIVAQMNEGITMSEKRNRDLSPAVRRLTPCELTELRRDMAESSAWAKAELKRRRAAKNQKNLSMV